MPQKSPFLVTELGGWLNISIVDKHGGCIKRALIYEIFLENRFIVGTACTRDWVFHLAKLAVSIPNEYGTEYGKYPDDLRSFSGVSGCKPGC